MIRFLFVADSRGNKFSKYSKPKDKAFHFTIDFITLRGAKIYNLVGPTIHRLSSYGAKDIVVVRLAAGINDLTTFAYDLTHEYRVLKSSNHTSESLFQQLSNFENAILTARANTLVSNLFLHALVTFTTIPPASFAKFQTSKKLRVPIISEVDIQKQFLWLFWLPAIQQFNNIDSSHGDFSIYYMNSRSLCRHFFEIQDFLATLDHSFTIYGFTETRFKEAPPSYVHMKNYQLIHSSRSSRPGGGVAMFLSNSLNFSIRNDLMP